MDETITMDELVALRRARCERDALLAALRMCGKELIPLGREEQIAGWRYRDVIAQPGGGWLGALEPDSTLALAAYGAIQELVREAVAQSGRDGPGHG